MHLAIRRLYSSSPADTFDIAAALVRELNGRGVVALHGEMGSGKTAFAQGMAAAMGVSGPVASPTFAIVNLYRGALGTLAHMDLHRLADPEELLDIGFVELLEEYRLVVIEWPEIAGGMLPAATVHVILSEKESPGEREIRIGTAAYGGKFLPGFA